MIFDRQVLIFESDLTFVSNMKKFHLGQANPTDPVPCLSILDANVRGSERSNTDN